MHDLFKWDKTSRTIEEHRTLQFAMVSDENIAKDTHRYNSSDTGDVYNGACEKKKMTNIK